MRCVQPFHLFVPQLTTQRLYVTNLPSAKIQKADLRTSLYMLFSTYGPVLDVVALKTMSMRGQAHIVYRDVQTSTQAMRHLEGQVFLGRPLVRGPIHPEPGSSTEQGALIGTENPIRQVQVKFRRQVGRNLQDSSRVGRRQCRADGAAEEHL